MSLDQRELNAIFSLLDDPDPTVQEAVRERIMAAGEGVISPLLIRVEAHGGQHGELVKVLTQDIRVDRAIQRMQRIGEGTYDIPGLEEGAWAIARFGHPTLDVQAHRFQLDEMARTISVLAGPGANPSERYHRLRTHVFGDLGFQGDRTSYFDPDNSYLNKVIERRKGIPISLSVLTMLVAGRVGVELRGVGMPMHFLLAFESSMDEVFIDPFNGGAMITYEDCRALLAAADVTLTHDLLEPVTNRAIMIRMWRNLLAAYHHTHMKDERHMVTRILEAITGERDHEPDAPDDEDDA